MTVTTAAFLECLKQWRHHWEKCMLSKGDILRVIKFTGLQVSLFFFLPKALDTFLIDLVC